MMRTISILGVGWLGLPLARKLISNGYKVKGSVTSEGKMEMLQQTAIWPFQLLLTKDGLRLDNPAFFDTDVLIISIPPRRTADVEEVFPAQIKHLIRRLEQAEVKKVIFISSTSVYPETSGVAKETDVLLPEKASGKALLDAENLFRLNHHFKTTIIRFGGLIGADRNPARFLSRKSPAVSGSKPVNLIHQDDCISIIKEIIRQNAWGETFNACCPEHPSRKDFYMKASAVSGIPAPRFSDEPEPYKIVDSSKLIRYLDYRFKYPSPLSYLVAEF
ncbi:SDR family oxidoreductase [Mangrovibacterium lignilyticum]|uniref:SDR family oxidoreductase n=1 Tax=Mangrovibacterium lignilyticum TaxID=2668052 RepID=UPI0013D0F028|nr:SDR family oxidoreductase [Mangrovibacterium lignilyticum]